MTTHLQDAGELVRRAQLVVGEARARAKPFRAWELLQERDSEGNVQGALPYTENALAQLEAAYERDPEDIGLVHHLAIAHHARAWDWELTHDKRAADEWERALNYWRSLAFASGFWEQLKKKLYACDAEADAAVLDVLRQDLLENLLDVHVDFVRHYCEYEAPERALAHVRIVQRARLPPAVKKRLVDKVFTAMTGVVPEARARSEHDSALMAIERFLALYPDYLPGLRLYAEVCNEYLSGLSYLNEWDDIVRLSARAVIWMRRLAVHPELPEAPLAHTALEDLAYQFLLRGDDRADSCLAGSTAGGVLMQRDAACAAYELGLEWARLAYSQSPNGCPLRQLAMRSMNGLALCLGEEARDTWQSDAQYRSKLAATMNLYRRAADLLQEAMVCCPGNETVANNLKIYLDNLSEYESKKTRLDLFGTEED